MPRNGTGTFSKAVSDFVNGTTASATDMNTLIDDIGDEITNSVSKDGQTVYTGEHDWNGNLMITDTDGDSKIGSSADDQVDFTLASTLNYKFTTTGMQFVSMSNPTLIGNDTDGVVTLSPNTASLGGIIKLYGDTHATKAGDIEFYDDTTLKGSFDASANTWDFNNIDGTIIGATTPAAVTTSSLVATTADINGGTVDGTVIGGASAAAITGTTITASTSLALASGATVTAILDEDTMSSDSATALATQQSIKAYVDAATAANGDYIFISAASASNDATIDFALSGSYDEYELRVLNAIPATDSVVAWLRTSADSGLNYDSTGTHYAWALYSAGSVAATANSTAAGEIQLSSSTYALGSDANELGYSGVIRVIRPSESTYTLVSSTSNYQRDTGATAVFSSHGTGTRLSAAAVTNVRFMFSSGNVESGLFALYGVKRT